MSAAPQTLRLVIDNRSPTRAFRRMARLIVEIAAIPVRQCYRHACVPLWQTGDKANYRELYELYRFEAMSMGIGHGRQHYDAGRFQLSNKYLTTRVFERQHPIIFNQRIRAISQDRWTRLSESVHP